MADRKAVQFITIDPKEGTPVFDGDTPGWVNEAVQQKKLRAVLFPLPDKGVGLLVTVQGNTSPPARSGDWLVLGADGEMHTLTDGAYQAVKAAK